MAGQNRGTLELSFDELNKETGAGLDGVDTSEKRWLKAELHAHCNLDPSDHEFCRHTPQELISRAAELGYRVLAITCHNIDVWSEALSGYAKERGVTLIPGMEVTVHGRRHTLVYNFKAYADDLNDISKIRELSRDDTLVVAPHPFFPGRSGLRNLLEQNMDVFDAIECSGFYVPGLDFNRRAESIAARTGKPMVGNGDVHYLWQLDKTFTWVYSEPGVQEVIAAIRQGLVRVERNPLTWAEVARWWTSSLWRSVFPSSLGVSSDEVENGRCFGPAQERMEP